MDEPNESISDRYPCFDSGKSIFEANRRTMAGLVERAGIALRPHYKSYKCPTIAKLQIADGAIGLCCAKLSEAENLADCGVEDIFIANQIVQQEKLGSLAALAECLRGYSGKCTGIGNRNGCCWEYPTLSSGV